MDSNRKKRASAWFYQTLYRDEQILPRPSASVEAVPEPIRAMRELERDYNVLRESREALFVRQGRQMESYEDAYSYDRDVVRYFPTYQSLTDRELRGYFSWRTAWRRGEKRGTSLSFAFLYVYELLNQIGVRDPVEGFEKLRDFERDYGTLDGKILSYLHSWIYDYVIYYRLDPILLADEPVVRYDRQAAVLRDMAAHSDAELLDALLELSAYRLDRSKLYALEPEVVSAVAVRVVRKMDAYYAKNRKQTLAEEWFGALAVEPFQMFESAVFYETDRTRSDEYVLDPLTSYSCRNGRWTVLQLNKPWGRSKKLGDVMRTVDACLRELLGVGNSIQPGLSTKWIVKLIQEECGTWLKEKEEEEARRVTIDYSKLSGIRFDASVTREKLIVDEEREEAEAFDDSPAPLTCPEGRPEPAPGSPPAAEDGLDAAERRLLRCLLYGGDFAWLREEGFLPAVLADSINEKLFDRFGDTVLLVDDVPAVVDDYANDLKEMIPT